MCEKCDKLLNQMIKMYDRSMRQRDIAKELKMDLRDVQRALHDFGNFEHTKQITKENLNPAQTIKPFYFTDELHKVLGKYVDM
ncbi:hypothetical protein [[Clostridium] aminophilum]|uniref:Uncharacterized protein n=1 Tax=[Clostridium] aminophilum TaxID=1526 RepID=A0A1I6K6J3_9FIRM|nr:hypothetical protein [[Clostridium] aminophilum]SFR86470.1 hypothetical protein SAMN02910262_02269 [[Clostridium] aminophilum]